MKLLLKILCLSNILFVPSSSQYIEFETADFSVKLNTSTQTLASLSPKALPSFDFSPFDVLSQRSKNGNYHLGDIVIRYRAQRGAAWTDVNSATKRAPVTLVEGSTGQYAVANLKPTLPAGIPLNVTRIWGAEASHVTLSFTIENTGSSDIEIGSLGFPIEFNSIFTGRRAEETQQKCSLTDPNIGLDAGYLRVTPLSGVGPALTVTPLEKTPFEAWRFLPEDQSTTLGYQSQTFEGFYSWEVYSKAYAENEWKATTPWNPASSVVIQPGQQITHGLRFSVAGSIEEIESVVENTGTPAALGVPGYIIPRDVDAQLYLRYNSTISSITSEPNGEFTFEAQEANTYKISPTATAWGRVRVEVNWEDGAKQTIHYYITKSGPQALADLGSFLTSSQWFTDTSDPFGRAPSVISYDRSTNDFVTQDPRVWIAGLSDEGGAGSWLAATMKQAAQPNAAEVEKLEDFIHGVLWGVLQQPDFSVRKSVFFYEPGSVAYQYDTAINWGNWWSWNKANAYDTRRAYDYVHVAAAYWALYRVARSYPDLVTQADWEWYLNQAYQTIIYFTGQDGNGNPKTDYADVGLMGETVFGELLEDLKRENHTQEVQNLEAAMRRRALIWDSQAVPYGSEMAWDSTGQEGVYYWSNYFGFQNTATKTIDSILGYMPTVSHWAWNGNARRYWDNIYGGKLQRIERQVHHYGSGLNALPLLSHFESHPEDTYILRVGHGGTNGPLSNIDSEGFASAAFHSWPDTLAWDAYSGDYGPGFLGLVLGSGTYVVDDPDLGLVAYGGTLNAEAGGWNVELKDAVRKKVFVAISGLKFFVDAGAIESLRLSNGNYEILVAPNVNGIEGMPKASSAILRIQKTAQVGSTGEPVVTNADSTTERGGWRIDLSNGSVLVNVALV